MTENDDKRDEFALTRDKFLLGFGMSGIIVIVMASIFLEIRNPELALAALTICGGLLGAPTILRYDERRAAREDVNRNDPQGE